MISGRYPCPLLCQLIDDTGSLFLVVGEFNLSQVVFAEETASIEDCVMIRPKFGRVSSLYGVDEIALTGVFHKCI